MITDIRTIPVDQELTYDLCVIGSGAAGLTIADAFRDTPARVAVLEAGGSEYDAQSQFLYDGELAGIPYYPLDSCRLRYFGGTTNHWSGYCAPFREKDFAHRPWIARSGWPIGVGEMQPFIERAARTIGLPERGWDVDDWLQALGLRDLALDDAVLARDMLLIRPHRFADASREPLERSRNVHVLLHAPVVEIETVEDAAHVTGVRIAHADGREWRVRATTWVLAAGGIENPRLLLASNRHAPHGLGNEHDLVGRFFSDHLGALCGILEPADRQLDIRAFARRHLEPADLQVQIDMPEEVERREQLVPASIRMTPVYDSRFSGSGLLAMRRLRAAMVRREWPDRIGQDLGQVAGDFGNVLGLMLDSVWMGGLPLDHVELRVGLSPAPNPDSRVTLTEERDALGLPVVKLDWRLSPIDRRSARWMIETFAAEAGAAGLGRVRVLMQDDDDGWPEGWVGAYHHMGTTRMAENPRDGVVDANCRVHGIDNLYVAGSSVFPTSGDASPTMMIVAMAMRLAEHLKESHA